jgi:predicted PurR-regulated permease PerM
MTRSLDAIILRYVGYALLFGAVAYLLFLVRGAIPIFAIAALLAYAMEPILQRLERKGYSRAGAIGFVFLLFLLLFALFIALMATAWQQAQTLSLQLPTYQKDIMRLSDVARERLDQLHLPQNLKIAVLESIADLQKSVPAAVTQKVQDAVGWTLSSISLLLIVLIVLPIITLWFMVEMERLRLRLFMLVPPQYRRDVAQICGNINDMLGRYVRGQMIVCSLFGVLCTIAFYVLYLVFGMQYPLVLGVLAALIYIVPYFGMATIAIAAGLTAYFTSSSPVACAILAVGSCVLFNLTIDYGITPRVIGKGVGLHPLMVIFALLCGAQLGGIVGMVLAIPFFAALRVVAIHLFPQLAAPLPASTPGTTRVEQELIPREGIHDEDETSEIITEVVAETTRVKIVADTTASDQVVID